VKDPTAIAEMNELNEFLRRALPLLDRLEALLPDRVERTAWTHDAYRWRPTSAGGWLQPVAHPHRVALDDLLCLERQKAEMLRNTEQFVRGRPANNVLLWGSRGTGKSTLVKAVFNHFVEQGLRLVEVDNTHLIDLPDIVTRLHDRRERFILYCDDLSFEADDPSYKALKAVLEGSIAAPPENVLIYATSNRRHLLPEFHNENREARMVDGELHQGEAVEEKVSLSERFGLWLSFRPFSQDQYLAVADHWLRRYGLRTTADEKTRLAALQWATQRGSRSGRVARQFALDQAGRQA
jgi:predicted AAA+ superfamily ATPase